MVDQGEAALISEARAQLVRRFSAAAVLAEKMEAELANGKTINISEHALLCSTLVRLAGKIGINRIPKDIEPSSLTSISRSAKGGREMSLPSPHEHLG